MSSNKKADILENRYRWAGASALAALFLLICALIVLSLVPPVSKDALTHHLAVPKLYLKHRGIYEIPYMPSSYYPMNLELLYMIPLYFGNEIAPKLIHFTFSLFTAWLIFGYLKSRTSVLYALLGALFFLSIPIIVKLSITVYVDLGLIFFSTAALLSLLRWPESGFQSRYLIISSISCGMAMGTKYNGLITFFLLALFVPFIYARYEKADRIETKNAVGYSLVFIGIALLTFSPWMLKNFLWTGNPIYPLYDQWFHPAKSGSGHVVGIFAYRALVFHETWWEILLLPFRIFFQGQDSSPQYFDGKLNPFLLIFTSFIFFTFKRNAGKIKAEQKTLLAFASLYFVFAFFSSGLRVRYISPIIPPLVMLSIYGMEQVFRLAAALRSPRIRQAGIVFAWCLIIMALGLNAVYLVRQFNQVAPFSYLNGAVSREEYIESYRPEYPAMKYINNYLQSEAKVLFLFIGNRGYYCDRNYVFDMRGAKSKLLDILKEVDEPKTVWRKLRGEGFSHLLINLNILNRWAKNSFDPLHQELLRLFFEKYLKRVYSKNGFGVFVLVHP